MTFSRDDDSAFLEGFKLTQITTEQIFVVMGMVALLSLYEFFCYRLYTRRSFYSKGFNISLVCVAEVTGAIILTIQSSIVVSLGMVGALSIVRFRTAVKEPMDLVFLYWAISIGIICGVGLAEIAIIMSLFVTMLVFVLDRIPLARAPMILVVNGRACMQPSAIQQVIKSFDRYATIRSQRMDANGVDMIFELRVDDGTPLVNAVNHLKNVNSVTLLSHDGEVTF